MASVFCIIVVLPCLLAYLAFQAVLLVFGILRTHALSAACLPFALFLAPLRVEWCVEGA